MEKNGVFYPSEAHLRLREKNRRLIFQMDALGEAEMRGMDPVLYEEFIFGYLDQRECKIDSVYWDFMLSGDFYAMYESTILPRREGAPFDRWIQTGFDMMGVLTAGAKKRGVENILVHRIAEVDIDTPGADYAEKKKHPEWTVGGSWYEDWLRENNRPPVGLLNIAHPEVQKRKLLILEECLRKYPFDGLEIDLCRHTPFLPIGREWDNRGALTEFLAALRRMLDRLENELGRPMLLSIRTGESPEGVRRDGVDVETLLDRNILDSITAGGRAFYPDLEGYRAMINGYGGHQQLYTTIDYHHASDGYACPPIEVWRGVCADSYARGADAVKLFNWWTSPAEKRREIAERGEIPSLLDYAPNAQDQAIEELGDQDFLQKASKTHIAERRGGYPWSNGYSNTNAEAPLPMELLSGGELSVYVSDRREDIKDGTVTLMILCSEADKVEPEAFLNRKPLPLFNKEENVSDRTVPPRGVDWASGYRPDRGESVVKLKRFWYEVEPDSLLTGWNRVRLAVNKPIRLEKCEISVKYSMK